MSAFVDRKPLSVDISTSGDAAIAGNRILEHGMTQHPFIFSSQRIYRFRRHLVFWTFWWLFFGFLYSFVALNAGTSYGIQLTASLVVSLIYLPVHMLLTYALLYFVIPKYLLKQYYWQTAAWVVFLFFLSASFSALLSMNIVEKARDFVMGNRYIGTVRTPQMNFFLSLMAGLRGAITIGGIAAAIKLMKYWYLKELRNRELLHENLEARMQLLKAQVHPHFLFNTLNNIYAFSKNEAPEAARLVMGLSEILRFMLYEGHKATVPLNQELRVLNDYIALEKIRYGNRLDCHVHMDDQATHYAIAPLLLLPLVENAFKHGISAVAGMSWISLEAKISNHRLEFNLMNGKPEQQDTGAGEGGIGIANVRKRLKLIYPGNHQLTLHNLQDVFIVNLELSLLRIPQPQTATLEYA